MSFQSVLFPVDFSPMSEATAPHVKGLAETTGATVTLLHVVPWLAAWYGTEEVRPAIAGSDFLRGMEQQQAKALTAFRERWFNTIPGDCIVTSGAVAETIVETAQELKADLIMMPTRGLGANRPFLIGSTTAKVLHDAVCAVWTTPHRAEVGVFHGLNRILAALSEDDVTDEYLEKVVTITASFQGTLHLLSVLATPLPESESELDPQTVETIRRELRARIQEISPSLIPRVHVEAGPVGEAVKKVAAAEQCNLVIANRGHLQKPFGRSRTHVYEIVLGSPCPVLSLNVPLPSDSSPLQKNKAVAGSRPGLT